MNFRNSFFIEREILGAASWKGNVIQYIYLYQSVLPALASAQAAYRTDENLPYVTNFLLLLVVSFAALTIWDYFRKKSVRRDVVVYLLKWTVPFLWGVAFSKLFYTLGASEPGISLSARGLLYAGAVYYSLFLSIFYVSQRKRTWWHIPGKLTKHKGMELKIADYYTASRSWRRGAFSLFGTKVNSVCSLSPRRN